MVPVTMVRAGTEEYQLFATKRKFMPPPPTKVHMCLYVKMCATNCPFAKPADKSHP